MFASVSYSVPSMISMFLLTPFPKCKLKLSKQKELLIYEMTIAGEGTEGILSQTRAPPSSNAVDLYPDLLHKA